MPGKRSFDAQLAGLETLRRGPPDAPSTVEALRKALGSRNNYIVAKAADLARDLHLGELIPELLAAFHRFFVDPVKSDPQCWAKNAASRALAAFDCQDAKVFLRGMRHVQLEPVWGGSADTAGTLRATCALALVGCRSLSDHQLLANLVELFADKDKSVRAETARAVAQAGSSQAALLLRLRAVLAGDEPEVLGACFSGILSIEGTAAVSWLGRFLEGGDDVAAEAALAIAQDRSPEAFRVLRERFVSSRIPRQPRSAQNSPDIRRARRGDDGDPWFSSVLLSAIALTRREDALAFLFGLVEDESPYAEPAIEAILRSGPLPETLNRLEEIVRDKPRLAAAFAQCRQPAR